MDKADFSGYATKAGLKCSDGRTIMPDAFKHQDNVTVPLVWSHNHSDPDNVLGHAVLEAREDGIYAYGYFNDTAKGQSAKKLVAHKDVSWLSIYANQLIERSKQVFHGVIREVSLVLAGANPGAKIDYVSIVHGDGEVEPLEDEAVIFTGLALEHADSPPPPASSGSQDAPDPNDRTMQDLFDTLTEEQKQLVNYMIGAALADAGVSHSETPAEEDTSSDNADQSEDTSSDDSDQSEDTSSEGDSPPAETTSEGDNQSEDTASDDQSEGVTSEDQSDNNEDEGDLAHQEGTDEMTHNVFEQNGVSTRGTHEHALKHDDLVSFLDKMQGGASFKDLVLAHAAEYGITDIDLLFPDAKALTTSPDFISRRMEWVATVLGGTKHSPFAKVKSFQADITADEARAKGYVKGNRKVEEVFGLLKRTTGPQTVYKKQKLDKDDIIDITDIDVVAWLKAEMRLMIEEELARAILVGDGRSNLSDDKVKDPQGALDGVGIRSILHDDDLYAIKTDLAANVSPKDAVKGLVRARSKYRGSGKPTLFVSDGMLTDIMLEEDKFGRPLYESEQALADKLRVSSIVTVDLFDEYDNLFAIMVNLVDYTIGSNMGGQLTSYEDFDIDYNQQKYLQETRLSGGLTKPFSAVVVTRAVGTAATATTPSYDGATDTITIPTATGVDYTIDDEVVTGNVVITGPTEVEAVPQDGYYLGTNTTRSWTYTP